MLLSGPFEKFVEASPVTVMMRGIVENLFHPERLNRLFEENAVTQYTRTLPFSTVAEVMGGRRVQCQFVHRRFAAGTCGQSACFHQSVLSETQRHRTGCGRRADARFCSATGPCDPQAGAENTAAARIQHPNH